METDLKGVSLLELVVEPTDDGPSGDHALGIEPRIEYDGAEPVAVDAGYAGDGPVQSAPVRENLIRKIGELPIMEYPYAPTPYDWLIDPSASHAALYATPDGKGLIFANVSYRIWRPLISSIGCREKAFSGP